MWKPWAVSSLSQPNLETCAGLDANLRRRERESLGGDLDDASVLSLAVQRARLSASTAPVRTTNASSLIEVPHQNHHPSPTLNEFGALISELWLRTIE